jgi:Tfp pilus assembly protein PilF
MLMPAMLLLAILGPSPQEPAATPSTQPSASAPTGSASDDIHAGLEAFRKRRFTQARTAFERAVAADPQSAAAHYYLGYTIYKIAEPKRHDSPGKKEAAEHFAKAYELDPGFKPVWGSRG